MMSNNEPDLHRRWTRASGVSRRLILPAMVLSLIAMACDRDVDGGPEGRGAGAQGVATSAPGGTGDHDHDHGGGGKAEAGHVEGDAHDHGHGEHADEVVLTPQAIRDNGIRVATAKSQTLTATLVAPARVSFNGEQMAHVGSAVEGRVKELSVRIGQTVSKGDPLLVIDSPELGEAQSGYLQKRTALEVAGPAVELAQESFERAQKLYDEKQGIALTEVQRRKGEYQAARGALRLAEAILKAAENRLHLLGMDEPAVEVLAQSGEVAPAYTIRAPIDGRVVEREITLGELVGPDKEKLLVLADLHPIWVLADVPEAQLRQVTVGSTARVTVPSVSAEAVGGKVAYIQPEIDPSTRTARVRIEVPNEQAVMLPGMFATVEIAAGSSAGSASEPVVAVPEEAIQNVEGEPAVFVPVEGEPNTFAKRAVGVGRPVGGMVPVLAGLKEGEKYVASGSFLLKAELGKAGAAHEH